MRVLILRKLFAHFVVKNLHIKVNSKFTLAGFMKENFLCSFCNKTYRESSRKSHMKYTHGGKDTFHNCPHCDYKSLHKFHTDKHIKSIHEGLTHQCPKCDFIAKWKTQLGAHIRAAHEGKTYQCPHCEYKPSWKGSLSLHIKVVHEGKSFHCSRCEYKTKSKSWLRNHEKVKHQQIV